MLVKNQIDLLKEKRTRIAFKHIRNEYAAQVGFFTGLNTQYANVNYYKDAVVKGTEISPLDFEIKKETEYEQNYKDYVLVVYAILLKQEEQIKRMPNITKSSRRVMCY